MKYNKSISTLEILQEYPYSAYFQSIDKLDLKHVKEVLSREYNFKLDSLNHNYVHVYNNHIIIYVNVQGKDEINLLVFSEKEQISDEVIQTRREHFFNYLEQL